MLIPLMVLIQAQQGPLPLPRMLPNADPWFQTQVRATIEAINKRNYTEARELVSRLPSSNITIQWDPTGIPKNQVSLYEQARDRAITLWSADPRLKFKVGKTGDLKIGFSSEVLRGEDGVDGAPTVLFRSLAPSDPLLEAVIATKRTEKRTPATMADIYNEIGYSIGSYLGVAAGGDITAVSFRSPLSGDNMRLLGKTDLGVAASNLGIVERLRQAIAKQQVFEALSNIQLTLEPREFKLPNAYQGDMVETSMAVSNTGASPARFRVVPECGCFALNFHGDLKPGETHVVNIKIDTSEYVGNFKKTLHFFSNDPDKTELDIPVTMWIEPRLRIVDPLRRRVLVVTDEGLSTDLYAILGKDVHINVTNASVEGMSGVASVTPWKGKISDPLTGKTEAVEREGFKISLLLSPGSLVPGRSNMNVKLETDSQILPILYANFQVQKGIAAIPASVYFGELGTQTTVASVLLSRPGKPFKIKSIRTNSSNFTASAVAVGGDEYRLNVRYDGKGPSGNLRATVTVTTDDPTQKEFVVPITGTIQ